jgi:hypothetical protein
MGTFERAVRIFICAEYSFTILLASLLHGSHEMETESSNGRPPPAAHFTYSYFLFYYICFVRKYHRTVLSCSAGLGAEAWQSPPQHSCFCFRNKAPPNIAQGILFQPWPCLARVSDVPTRLSYLEAHLG